MYYNHILKFWTSHWLSLMLLKIIISWPKVLQTEYSTIVSDKHDEKYFRHFWISIKSVDELLLCQLEPNLKRFIFYQSTNNSSIVISLV